MPTGILVVSCWFSSRIPDIYVALICSIIYTICSFYSIHLYIYIYNYFYIISIHIFILYTTHVQWISATCLTRPLSSLPCYTGEQWSVCLVGRVKGVVEVVVLATPIYLQHIQQRTLYLHRMKLYNIVYHKDMLSYVIDVYANVQRYNTVECIKNVWYIYIYIDALCMHVHKLEAPLCWCDTHYLPWSIVQAMHELRVQGVRNQEFYLSTEI